MTNRNKSGKQGVYWDKTHERWVVEITDNKHKKIHKYFKNIDDAIAKRIELEKEYGYIGD